MRSAMFSLVATEQYTDGSLAGITGHVGGLDSVLLVRGCGHDVHIALLLHLHRTIFCI